MDIDEKYGGKRRIVVLVCNFPEEVADQVIEDLGDCIINSLIVQAEDEEEDDAFIAQLEVTPGYISVHKVDVDKPITIDGVVVPVPEPLRGGMN